jgi:cold shock protein
MERGVIKAYLQKGFGFIRPDFGDEDLFFHIKALPPGVVPSAGDRVMYEVEISKRTGRPAATNVQIVAGEAMSYGRTAFR